MLRSKPQDSRWTDDQWAAITERGSNLLVAAAAGSGKTAVLVERIIRLISDEGRPVDVDQLLVATFTNAAAAEMRERIRDALERELRDRPDADHLRRQLALMNRAQITTLHSFCLEVIRRYFQLIPLDPGFRIANETEAQLIRLDVLEQLLENKYNNCEEGDGFWRLADWFGGERGDDSLYRLVQQLYDQARSMPWPEAWLRSMAEMFHPDSTGERLELWQRSLLNDVRLELQGALEEISQAASIVQSPGGPEPYLDNLYDERTKLAELLQHTERGWDDLYAAFQFPIFGRLKACRGDQYDKDLQEQVKKLRDQAKARWGKLREELFVRTSSEYVAELSALSPAMDALVELVSEFSQRYSEAKAAKGLVDFADLEHYCLHILRDPESDTNQMAPSAAALEFQKQFVEILLDEYQDTNQVQEAIVALISRDQPGNRFMVGDVKQSIYRFRLADPGLFLQKYRAYMHYASDQPARDERVSGSPKASGQRIDLAQNFRSRAEVVDGVNFIFSQIMNERVGEIAYDDKARLVLGAADYPDPAHPDMEGYEADFTLIDRSTDTVDDPEGSLASSHADEEVQEESDTSEEGEDPNDLNNAQLEARYIAKRIQTWMGQQDSADTGATGRLEVWDKSAKQMRPLQYRDIVILLRATQTWAPTIIEELRLQGIPAYAELGTGYFAAIEIEVILSLLKIADNPYQDIPLTAVLRSPIFGVSAEQLAHIRIYAGGAAGNSPFFDAVLAYAGWDSTSVSRVNPQLPVNAELRAKIQEFLVRLEQWRRDARLGALADLIWKLFDDTGYYDFVGGMPGGVQRQANLRALYDRARQYEATSFRGLFRFLRFIERMKETGGDLGTARALGEQEDVVRIMSIHKSKGLEFPVVFVAGLSKQFNRQDLNSHFLLHKDLGFGPKYIDSNLRLSYPSLPALAIRRSLRLEMLAEELRVLYVALTRAREKLCLVATSRSVRGAAAAWQRDLQHGAMALPEQRIAQANSFLDWLGPSLIRHRDARILRDLADCPPDDSLTFPPEQRASSWIVAVVPAEHLAAPTESAAERQPEEPRLQALRELNPVSPTGTPLADNVRHRLSWEDPLPELSLCFAKTSVSELKRMAERQLAADSEATFDSNIDWLTAGRPGRLSSRNPAAAAPQGRLLARRPAFMERKEPTAAERGTIYHFLMQHLSLQADVDIALVEQTVSHMLMQELLAPEQAELIDPSVIVQFFRTGVGKRLLRSPRVEREVPFSYGLPASEVYDFAQERQLQDTVLIQGVIDCLFEEDEGWVLLDYKTDAVYEGRLSVLQERYRIQLDVYSQAVEHIWGHKVIGKYLYFFDGGHLVNM